MRNRKFRAVGLVAGVASIVAVGLSPLSSAAEASVSQASGSSAGHGHGTAGDSGERATTNGRPLAMPTWKKLATTSQSHPYGGDAWTNRGIGLSARGYAEDEYLVSGPANVYASMPATDFQTNVINQSTYTTRAIVRHPKDMSAWSGNVVVEYMNVTDGVDLQIIWTRLREQILDSGDVYVGFTGKGNVIPILRQFDPARYGTVDMPNPVPAAQQTCGTSPDDPAYNPNTSKLFENGLLWDMWSQIGLSFKTSKSPLGSAAKRVLAVGESQSGSALQNYYRWFGGKRTTLSNGSPVFDGNLDETGGRPTGTLNQCGGTLPAADPQRASNMMPDRGTPYFTVHSQWDAWTTPPPPAKNYRYWDVAGADHVDREMYDRIYPISPDLVKSRAAGDGAFPWQVAAGATLELYSPYGWFCDDASIPELGLPAVERSAYRLLNKWVAKGSTPPIAPYLQRSPDGSLVLDGDENALGGIRLPEIQAAIAQYSGGFFGNCTDSHHAFSASRLAALYPSQSSYLNAFTKAAKDAVKAGYISSDDAEDMVSRAQDRPIP